MNRIKKFVAILLFACLFFSCDKEDSLSPSMGNGTIYYYWATEGIKKINLQTGIKATVLPQNLDRHGWDISQDGKKILQILDGADQEYNAYLYSLTNLSDATIVTSFKYYPTEGDISTAVLSPTGSLIAVQPTYHDGIVILNLQGKVLHHLISFQEQDILHGIWMPDETLLFTTEEGLFRTDKAFKKASLIKSFDFADWGAISVSNDGSKIALRGGNHIWMMNADGSGLVQVTESNNVENFPVFSPDGEYLLVATDYQTTGPFGHIWNMAIMPADGQRYNVNETADDNVIFVRAKGETDKEYCSGNMVWR